MFTNIIAIVLMLLGIFGPLLVLSWGIRAVSRNGKGVVA